MSESIFIEQEGSLLYQGNYKAVSPNLQGSKEFNRQGPADVEPEPEPEPEDPDPEIPDPEEG